MAIQFAVSIRAIALTFIAQVAAPHDEMLYAVHQWKMVVKDCALFLEP